MAGGFTLRTRALYSQGDGARVGCIACKGLLSFYESTGVRSDYDGRGYYAKPSKNALQRYGANETHDRLLALRLLRSVHDVHTF